MSLPEAKLVIRRHRMWRYDTLVMTLQINALAASAPYSKKAADHLGKLEQKLVEEMK